MTLPENAGSLRFDANMLRDAASILRLRSRKPRSFWLAVACKVLRDCAAALDRRADAL